MQNYTNKRINTVVICISLILTVILFIILDILFINEENNTLHTKNTLASKYVKLEKNYNSKINRKNLNSIKLEEIMLNIMQVADIYKEDTNTNNINDNKSENIKKTKSKWRIEIPKISLVAPIKEGTSQDILAIAVGHFEGSSRYSGNIALAGHNRGYNCNFFEDIKKLKSGDKIIYYSENGRKEYQVILNKIIHQTDWSYIEKTDDNRITLITCVENMYEYRRCVQAVEII